jgi:hypothetical protein
MHLIVGVPISLSASRAAGHVEKRATPMRRCCLDMDVDLLKYNKRIEQFYGPLPQWLSDNQSGRFGDEKTHSVGF